ncbi:UNVERIFIED_CONTAM: putative prolyl 4-hydroxylase 9 [Sesamum latifolium]|uniref:procollagen-proline 4-dioxygenase n=1 Tax=Sesamum latifolium TaxID=2727402 RepID=A0AAW2X817_9LAMI
MRIKGSKIGGGSWSSLGLPSIFLLCLFFFFAGFWGSSLLFQQEMPSNLRPRMREMAEERKIEFEALPRGDTGEGSVEAIPFQVLSWNPRALYFPNFATAEQCQSVIKMAKVHLKPSSLALRKGETAENTQGIRTSSGMFISASEDKTGILDQIESKIAKVTMLPKTHGEAFNVLRYEIGQRYHSHYDAFNPAEYGPQKSQRVASFLLYLSDVEGGETMFPFEVSSLPFLLVPNFFYLMGKTWMPIMISANVGLKVRPHRGDGLLFYSLFPNGTIDPTSLHGSCPVIKGEKWVATKWIRDQEQDDD